MSAFYASRTIVSLRALGWQIDYRPTGWLPLSWKPGRSNGSQPTILRVGRGHLTWGRVSP